MKLKLAKNRVKVMRNILYLLIFIRAIMSHNRISYSVVIIGIYLSIHLLKRQYLFNEEPAASIIPSS